MTRGGSRGEARIEGDDRVIEWGETGPKSSQVHWVDEGSSWRKNGELPPRKFCLRNGVPALGWGGVEPNERLPSTQAGAPLLELGLFCPIARVTCLLLYSQAPCGGGGASGKTISLTR